jgi:hypothetical protein
MKKLILSIFSFVSLSLQAQVYVGDNIHNGTNKRSYAVLSNQDGKEFLKSLESYLGQYGKVNKAEKNIYRIQNLKGNAISSDLSYIDVISKSSKGFEKLEFFFLNDANNALNSNELNAGEAEKFVQGFIDFSNANLESLLIKENVAFAEGELKDAQKEQSKIEKAIENNLKDQQKLGKKLDSSPELIAKAMSEKEEITSQLFTDSVAVLDDKAKTNLSKASQKKDREISKIEKNAKKAESNLEKKERELEDLKEELISAKTRVKAYQKALSDSKSLSIQKK